MEVMMGKRVMVIVTYNEAGNRIGETHHNARISDAVVDRIREIYEDENTGVDSRGRKKIGYRTIAKMLGLSPYTVKKIIEYRRRCDTPAKWKRTYITADKLRVFRNG